MNEKHCHRIRVNAPLLGFDPAMLVVTGLTFAVGCEVARNPFLAMLLALLAGGGVQLLRRDRMPGIAKALGEYLWLPSRLPALGRDRIPRYPGDSSRKGRHRHASV